jgi:hypothetical protein
MDVSQHLTKTDHENELLQTRRQLGRQNLTFLRATRPRAPIAWFLFLHSIPDICSCLFPVPFSYSHHGTHCLTTTKSSSFSMIWYPTPSDHRYSNGTNHTIPEGSGTYWALGGLDSSESQPPITRGSEDRRGPSRLRANHSTSSAYMSAPTLSFTQHQTQCDRPEQLPYQPLLCSRDPAEYSPRFPQILPGSSYHSGQYVPQPSDPNSFHHSTTYDTTGYSTTATDGFGLPLGSQHQQIHVSESSDHLRCDGFYAYYSTIAQRPISTLPSSCGSSELYNALVEIPSAEPQSTSCASIALRSLSQPAPKHFDYGELSQLGLMGMPGISMSNTVSNGQNTYSSSSSQYSPSMPFYASNASARVGQQGASSSSYSGSIVGLTNQGFLQQLTAQTLNVRCPMACSLRQLLHPFQQSGIRELHPSATYT